jgi:endonuclease/exonuclease/phosphatase family metal-dependent hydrolase
MVRRASVPFRFAASVLLLALLSCSPRARSAAAEPDPQPQLETVRVGSYNIQIFGKTKVSRPRTLTVLAEIGASFDAMAVQEVGSNGSSASDETCEAVLAAYASRMAEVSGGLPYAYVRGDQFAVVYRSDRFELLGWHVYDGEAPLTYKPLAVHLRSRAAALDFVLISVHTRPSRAAEEIAALRAVMAEAATRYGEPDVVCVGDFNADGSYYEEGEGAVLAGFDAGAYISVIPNDADTTVAAGSNAYDRMILSSALAEDYASSWGVLRPAERWDLSACEGTEATAGTEEALSDHYPVWADFFIGADTD